MVPSSTLTAVSSSIAYVGAGIRAAHFSALAGEASGVVRVAQVRDHREVDYPAPWPVTRVLSMSPPAVAKTTSSDFSGSSFTRGGSS